MAETILGVDMGHDSLKLALCCGGMVKKVASVPMPEHLLREGRVTSAASMGKLIRETMRKNGMRASCAAVALSDEVSCVREVSMPIMSEEQLLMNIPYEFSDYITEEWGEYVFDYAMLSTPEDLRQKFAASDGHTPVMELTLSAVRRTVLDGLRDTLRRAGLKLVKAAPSMCACLSLIRGAERTGLAEQAGEFCFLDLGFRNVRVHLFQGDWHKGTRVLETGLSVLDQAVADSTGVNVHLAHTYLLSNYRECQNQSACVSVYQNLAVELSRTLHFYRFRYPESKLHDIWLCGGGPAIRPLWEVLREMSGVTLHYASELLPEGDSVPDCYHYAEAIGITMD